jgi:predicted AAA+ superfamily ATPase
MGELFFKRKLYDRMLQWKQENDGKTALLINGARRVGKSTLAEQFAKDEYESYIAIDFSTAPIEILELFNDISDLKYLFLKLQAFYHVDLYERKSVIIFDEVQKQPLARQAIKHLVKDRRYDYIETGSLLSIKKSTRDIIIPSEETRVTLFPMDYEEFKWALGDTTTIPLFKNAFETKRPLGDHLNRRLMRDFRLYMLVGGMPQAVISYLETNNLSRVDKVKRNILELYEDDFRKIDPTGRLSLLFEAIPAELNKNASRYQVSSVIENSDASRMAESVAEMQDSMTVYLAYHSNDPNAGMSMHKDILKYKMFLCDTGLFVTLAFKDKDYTENIIYSKLLNDKLSADLGYVYENVTAQMLRVAGNSLFYYTFPKETSNHNYEIDFMLADGNKVSPIEVKASGYKTHASLDEFSKKYSDRIKHKFLLYSKDVQKEEDILCLPFYMAPFLGD